MKNTYILFLILLILAACGGGDKKTDVLAGEDTTSTVSQVKVDPELVGEMLESIPSPLEISLLIKQAKPEIKFSKTILNSTENISKYNTNYKKALNLGVYSTDLGYCNIYNQNQEALLYLDAVKEMADGLSIGQFFDMESIRRLATAKSTLDSLLVVTQQNFEKINGYLQEKQRSNQSVLMLTGGWLESLYLTCEIVKKNKNPELLERVGDQQKIITQLQSLLKYYESDPMMKLLQADLNNLYKHYDKVKVTYIYRPVEIKEVDGMSQVIDPSTTTIEVSDEAFNSIYDTVVSMRKKVTE
ncbi:MAG: hypothetical protein H7Y04_06640 [Verrucomicrobia bacterium]|nr:hypothetical protein [Cytophagales bacterium]